MELQTGGLRRAVLDLPFAIVAFAATAWIGGWVALAPLAMLFAVLMIFQRQLVRGLTAGAVKG